MLARPQGMSGEREHMGGLDDWMELLADRLNQALGMTAPGNPARVAIGRERDGEPGAAGLLLTLAALHPAPAARSVPRRAPGGAIAPSPLALEADLLVSARRGPDGYVEALQALSLAMRWLHANPMLDGASAPGSKLSGSLTIELVDLPLDQASALLAAFPADGMPFALYRLRGMAIG
jgi:hypothetical protein